LGPEAVRAPALTPAAIFAGFSGFDGANSSTARGEIWWPDLDTRLELDTFSRQEIQRRIRWAYANTGVVKGFIRNSADFIGWLIPQAATSDHAWNEEAEQVFSDRANHAEAFDTCGKFNFKTAQSMLVRAAQKDGEALTVLTEAKNGAARHAFYETQQLANPPDTTDTNWKDGIYIRGGRHLAYGLRDPATNLVTVVPASDVIYTGEFDSCGHHRVIPPLAHAINHAIDITEVWGFTKKAIKTASLFGAVRENKQASQPRARMGLTGSATTDTNADGDRFEVSKVWDGGQIPRLPTGEELKILSDSRPHPNQREFITDLVRDMSMGYGLPPEVIWGMLKMTGPGIRFVMDHAATWISRRQENLLRPWCSVVWARTIAKEIKAGRLRAPADPRWWAVQWVAQRDLTIDRGKEAKTKMDAIDRGLSTMARFSQEMHGASWEDETRQRIREVRFRMDECERVGVPYEYVYPPAPGAQPADPAESAADAVTAAHEEATALE
jgi:capsid protein